MSDAALGRAPGTSPGASLQQIPAWAQFALIIAAGVLLSLVWDGAKRWPAEWTVPAEAWLTTQIEWLKGEFDATVELATVREESVHFPLPKPLRPLAAAD